MDRTIHFDNNKDIQNIFGKFDQNLKIIEKEMRVRVFRDAAGLRISGDREDVDQTVALFDYLMELTKAGAALKDHEVVYAVRLVKTGEGLDVKTLTKGKIEIPVPGTLITPKSKGQFDYVEAIKQYDIVFGIGPAGTGKTYLAMAMAVNALKRGIVRRIILTRPAIEAGESLGFLPGDMVEKVSPYIRPLYDALYDMMEPEKVEELTEQGVIEVAPLAFMRGRTLNDAFVVLDEAQNSTPFQMKMFLTRLGFDSKTVITGDITQSDLPKGSPNGLAEAQKILKDIEGIKFITLTGNDVVRHELVQRIIEAYDRVQ
jgi:phosphate starvation-inducible PhoH-like protein